MGLTVHTHQGPFSFNGPHPSAAHLVARSGVYVISTLINGLHQVLDVGESHDVKDRVETHDRKNQWAKHMADALYVSAFYCNAADRMVLERYVRDYHNPPCGLR